MSLRASFLRISFSLLLVFTLSVLAFADTIRLKDGSIIKGRIVSFAAGRFTVAIGEGSRLRQLTFAASEIESITFDSPVDKPQVTASNRTPGTEPTIINTSSTTTATPTQKPPPRVVVTENLPRTNGTATIASGTANTPRNTNNPTTVKNTPASTGTPNVSRPTGNPTTVKNAPAATGTTGSTGGTMTPIVWNIKVLADNTNNGWTNSGWVLKKGQRIRITGEGEVSLGKGKMTTPSGLGDLADDQKLMKNVPTGALLAVIGDDNNDFIYIGAEREFTATRDGALFLGINEGNLNDNSGAFNVKVEIIPDKSN